MHEEKVILLHHVDNTAHAVDKRVQEVNANLIGVCEIILVVAMDGTLNADIRPLVCLSISVLVEDKGKYERGYNRESR